MEFFILLIFIAGFIDAIAGGGGLITIPALALTLGSLDVVAIGTNKVIAVVSTGVAFFIYLRKGYFKIHKGFLFALAVGGGAVLGGISASKVPPIYFKYFLFVTIPFVLYILFNRKFFEQSLSGGLNPKSGVRFVALGVLCGFYDGIWGPGGGTFMLLSLLVFLKSPLLEAIAISKFANLLSATGSLAVYSMGGMVVWSVGFMGAGAALVGSFLGAQLASQRASQIVRPVLALVVALLLIKTFLEL